MTVMIQKTTITTQAGDLVQMRNEKNQSFIFNLEAGKEFQTHLGIIPHDEMIGIKWGSRVQTHKEKAFTILQPALDDLLREIPRETQIMYPKDIGYVLVSMGIGPGSRVIESGSGSGALTTALAYIVGDQGKVYSYEIKEKHLKIAQRNLARFGLAERVEFKLRDAAEGFDEENIEGVFLDVQEPNLLVEQARAALIPGGHLGSILPTTNQVNDLITALKKNNFGFIEISEMMHRYYKASATRFRPKDRMVGHTGYLVFARRITGVSEE